MPQAMEAAGVPRTVEAARLIHSKMGAMLRAGVAPDVHQAAKMAAQELRERNFAILRSMPAAQIVEAIGKEAYDNLLRHSIAKPSAPAPTPQPTPKQNGRSYMTEAEARKFWVGE